MKREGRPTILIAVALCLVFLLMPDVAQANGVRGRLQDQYRGRTLILRGFYSGEHLHYDAGVAAAGAAAGDWTTDGFVQVDQIGLSGQNLKIKAKRLMVVSAGHKGLRLADEVSALHKTSRVEIDFSLGPGSSTEDEANAVMAKIFLTSQDQLAELVPYYWKPCLQDGMSGRNETCRFSEEIAAVPGMVVLTQSAAADTPTSSPTASDAMAKSVAGPFKVGQGVKPPRPLYQPEPSFSPPARNAKYQGTVTLKLIVDKEGLPKDIRISSPLGAGLDARAVRAVETWIFEPAQKNGQPVAVDIAVEVDFHLY